MPRHDPASPSAPVARDMPASGDVWRVAALTTMDKAALAAALSGGDAVRWIEAAAACGLAEAQLRLGRMLLSGEGVAADPKAAFACFRTAAGGGDIQGHNMLGRCHENGWGTPPDYGAAVYHYSVAAEAGLDWAQYNLAHMLLSGHGVVQDRAAAFIWYGKAAAQGHVRAMNLLARCHEEGWGTATDRALARALYRRAAEGGYFRGCYNYADLLAGDGDIAEAARWFEQALAAAPEPTRGRMLAALASHALPAIRALASHRLAQA